MRCNPRLHDSHGLSKRRSELPGNKVVCCFFSVCVLVCGKIETLGKTLPFILVKKGVNEPKAQTDGTYSGFLSRPRSITAPVDGTLVHRRDPCSSMSPVTICACTWVKRVTKCGECPSLSKETTRRARLESRTSRSGVRVFNRSATQAATKQCTSILMLYRCLSS